MCREKQLLINIHCASLKTCTNLNNSTEYFMLPAMEGRLCDKLDKRDGSGRSYLYATLNNSYKKLNSGNDKVIRKTIQFQNHG
jgi:hypothetical protein